MDSIAVLEITVSKLEQETVALQYQLSQERNERRLAEYRLQHLSCLAPSQFHCSLSHVRELLILLNFTLKSALSGSIFSRFLIDNSFNKLSYNQTW